MQKVSLEASAPRKLPTATQMKNLVREAMQVLEVANQVATPIHIFLAMLAVFFLSLKFEWQLNVMPIIIIFVLLH